MPVEATGHGLTAPVGEGTLGRMFDPLGRPIDGKGAVDAVSYTHLLLGIGLGLAQRLLEHFHQ